MEENKKNKIPNVPNLRFSGYTNTWSSYSLNETVERIKRKNNRSFKKRC